MFSNVSGAEEEREIRNGASFRGGKDSAASNARRQAREEDIHAYFERVLCPSVSFVSCDHIDCVDCSEVRKTGLVANGIATCNLGLPEDSNGRWLTSTSSECLPRIEVWKVQHEKQEAKEAKRKFKDNSKGCSVLDVC